MNIVILDYLTLGDDLDLSGAEKFGTVIKYPYTKPEEAAERTRDADVIIVNKVKMNESSLKDAIVFPAIAIAFPNEAPFISLLFA